MATKKGAIGYLSLGSGRHPVAAKIDDVEATPENIKNNTYAIARPFIVVTKGTLRADVQALIDFILGAEGRRSWQTTTTLQWGKVVTMNRTSQKQLKHCSCSARSFP